jgi:hypothetical protein
VLGKLMVLVLEIVRDRPWAQMRDDKLARQLVHVLVELLEMELVVLLEIMLDQLLDELME